MALALGCGRDDSSPTPDARAADTGPVADDAVPCEGGGAQDCTTDDGCPGSRTCIDGAFSPCIPPAEACNGRDDDCDGEVDESVPQVGEQCTFRRGTCESDGVLVCNSVTGALDCDLIPEAAPDEQCNGIDDDCDGATDEQVPPGPCIAGVGGCRVEGQAFCRQGRLVCAAEPAEAQPEVCNGLDDDCDGRADEDPTDVGRPCGTGVPGICGAGIRACEAGVAVCVPEAEAAAETCDGLDEDCDGAVDEDFGVGGACAAGDGVCTVAGVIRCVGGEGVCDAVAADPRTEVCNGLDDDCDGHIDEQPPVPETCNGIDDDCDGTIDEGFGLGAACTEGLGRCESAGEVACAADGGVRCDAVAGDPEDEVCNEVDDDCDGEVDEALGYGAPCEVGIGACAARGEGICSDQGAVVCFATPGQPQAERCDGEDDDCDGRTDEGFPLGEPCAAGVGACRVEGERICGGDGVICSAAPGAPSDEVCNGADDDCDQRTDEGFPLGSPCEVGVGACRARGGFVCAEGGGLRCDAERGSPTDEVCNTVDDDCDGRTDEGLGLGGACEVGLGACVRPGQRACGEAGDVICAGEPGPPIDELCNGIDDDCDGETDEGFDLGGACEGGLGACRRPGVRVCGDDGAVTCDAAPGPPAAERCNEVDDDCDGAVDEVVSCDAFDSCADALAAGGGSGTYLITGLDGVPYSLYCDQETDGGGWALVANSLGAPPVDQRTMWSPDLQQPAPTMAYDGVWPALRRTSLRHDIRFVCGRGADGPKVVDIAFYDVPWYRTITTGSDLDSCFNPEVGPGARAAPTIRRDLLTGEVRARGQGRLHADGDWLEGEDQCGALDDFAVDFDGRGLGGGPSPTAWGLFDGLPRCGDEPMGDGQPHRWQIWARPPRAAPLGTVGLLGPERLAVALADSGFAVELIDADPLPDLSRFAVIFFGRWSDVWAAMPANTRDALDAFVRGGGGLVTEYDGAAPLASAYDLDFAFALGAPPPWGWLPMTVGGGGFEGGLLGLQVDPDAAGDPIVRSMPDPIVGQRGPAFFVRPSFEGVAPGRVITNSVSPVGGAFVSTLRFARCGGVVLLNSGSYADAAAEAVIGQFVRNLAGAAASPHPAGVADVCPD